MSDEPKPEEAPQNQEPAKPEAPAGNLREQIIALVPDDQKSQVADLLRALLEHAPVKTETPSEAPASAKVAYRHNKLPFRSPLVTKEEVKREGANYGSISDDG